MYWRLKLNYLYKLTEELLEHNQLAIKMFEEYGLSNNDADFLTIVKPFVDDVKRVSDEWMVMATDYVVEEKPSFLPESLINNTYENLQIQALACFQNGIKMKRFYERNKSIHFVLHGLLSKLEN